jgi:nucleotide-binding universal stress UspA family protein
MSNAHRIVIVGVDYSDLCIPALDQALGMLALAARNGPGAVLIPLLVLPEEPASNADATQQRERIARAKANLSRLVNARASRLSLAPPLIIPRVRFGDPAATLLEEARQPDVDLVAVGTHARRGLAHLLIGSVAEEVMRGAPCSVLVARAAEPPTILDQHLPLDLGPIQGIGAEIDHVTEAEPPAAQVLSEPHIDAGRVVLHVLDTATGQSFSCYFSDSSTVVVEPLEREWVPQPSPAARARVI